MTGHVFVRNHGNGGASVAIRQADLNEAYAKAVLDPRVHNGPEVIAALIANMGIAEVIAALIANMGIAVIMTPEVPPKPKYGMKYRDGSMRVFPSKTAAVRFNRELPALALQYRKDVWVSTDDGETWDRL